MEVKWRNRPVSRADLAAFVQKARAVVEHLKLASTPTLWLISGGGFKASALAYAAEAGILVSGAQDVQELAELLGVKVHLFLHVKVNPRWDEDRGLYKDIGLDWSE